MTFSEPITLHSTPSNSRKLIGITADGGFLIHETIISGPPTCTLARPASPAQPARTANNRLFWLGSRSGTIASVSFTSNGCGGSGSFIRGAVMNSAGDVLTHESTWNVPASGSGGSMFDQLIVYPGNGDGPTVVGEDEWVNGVNVGPYDGFELRGITEWRQPIFRAYTEGGEQRLYSGPDPATDAFDGDFIAGFGQDGTPVELFDFSEKGHVVVEARLNDDSSVTALGNAITVIEWLDPAGGNWGDGTNWEGGQVPGRTSETLFNLDATYTVNVGKHNVGRVRIEDGFVTFENADLTLLGPLTVGNAATFELSSGALATDDLVVGSLAPADILNPPTTHVQILNPGTVLSATAVISISHASPGRIFLGNARINGGSLVIGENFPGHATLSGQHADWHSSGATAVGYNYTGTLSIENGAFMRSDGEIIIGQGSSLQEYGALALVRNFDVPLPADLGTNWLVVNTLTIGDFLRGELDISHGGNVMLLSDGGVLQAGLRAHDGPDFDAFISVDGSDDPATLTSTLQVFNNVLLGMANGASVGVNVNRGGLFVVRPANLFLGFETGSEAVMTVAGINDRGVRARLQVERPGTSSTLGNCTIGENGTGRLLIHSGGWVDCSAIRIGGLPGGSGFV